IGRTFDSKYVEYFALWEVSIIAIQRCIKDLGNDLFIISCINQSYTLKILRVFRDYVILDQSFVFAEVCASGIHQHESNLRAVTTNSFDKHLCYDNVVRIAKRPDMILRCISRLNSKKTV